MSERTDPLARALSLPIWQGPASAMRLGGGITNLNVLVTDCGRRAVVRIGDDIPVHQIMRFNELAASRAAHARGVVVVALTGNSSGKCGGKIAALLGPDDLHLCVPAERTARIQEVHLLAIHCLCDGIDALILGETQ